MLLDMIFSSVLRNQYEFPRGLACFKELVNLGRFDEWVSCDFELEPTFTNQCEERPDQCLRLGASCTFGR